MKHKNLLKAFLVMVIILAQLPWSSRPAQAATWTVTNTNNSGAGSLREAIIKANVDTGLPDTIVFDILAAADPGCNAITGVCTIEPTSPLPALTDDAITIDGYSQPGAVAATAGTSANLKIVIYGDSAGMSANGLIIQSANNQVTGLVINDFQRSGIVITGTSAYGNVVTGTHIGTNVTGSGSVGNVDDGVVIGGGAKNNKIGGGTPAARNIISGNYDVGVRILGIGTIGNTISGNYIGPSADGTVDLGNGWDGVYVYGGAQKNTIGGVTAGERNVISGNHWSGVCLEGSSTTGNVVAGNYIGTAANGTDAMGNDWHGVRIIAGASSNTIGGDTAGERNVISGNGFGSFGNFDGIFIAGSGTNGNIVSGNYIGVSQNGTADLGNAGDGVYIEDGASNNTIGGNTAGERNVISGNDEHGVYLYGSSITGIVVSGNYIGTNAAGNAGLGNGENGVFIDDGASNNTIGGDATGEGNVISGNNLDGIRLEGSATTDNVIEGNIIGLAANGDDIIGNAGRGVRIMAESSNNVIGGDSAGERNVISGNSTGVDIDGSGGTGSTGNVVSGNYIGTDASGMFDRGNTNDGVIVGAAQNNTIGGDSAGEGNLISGNGDDGVVLVDIGTAGNTVSGNIIGLNAAGTAAVGNTGNGIHMRQVQNNTIGGTTDEERNIISGNGGHGVVIRFSDAMSNTIVGNYIGTNITGTVALSNANDGVYIFDGAQHNTIGGDTPGERNVISGNGRSGVWITGEFNTVSGNYIGTDVSGTVVLSNTDYGVHIIFSSHNNIIGGDTTDECNVIAGNGRAGVLIQGSSAMSNTVSGNYIGVDATGAADLGNNGNGIDISEGRNNIIGGATSGERNVISGNDQRGIIISGADATGNTVLGNYIGTDASGSTDLGNTWSGVEIRSGAHHNLVGGSTPNERNIISGNDQDGVYIYSSDTTTNTISGNYIGLAANGTSSMGNTGYGVYISRSKFNVVGPNNVVAHNGDDGIFVVRSEAISNTITQNSIFSNTMGIRLWQSANGGIAAPVIITTIQGSVNIGGTACAGCTVEVFENSDTDGEGETYVGDTIADASGNFTVTVSALTQPYLTATATDVISGTSEFSDVFTVTVELAPGSGTIFLPIVLKNY